MSKNKSELEDTISNVLEAVHIQMSMNNQKALTVAMSLHEESIDIDEFNTEMEHIINMDEFLDTIHRLLVSNRDE